jgi:23S rRNA pseudouridine1911/1915/1917 synthase
VPSYRGLIGAEAAGLRLDRYIAEQLRLLRRSQIKSRALTAAINGKAVKISRPVKVGDCLELFWQDRPPSTIVPEPIPLDIVYEDSRVVVVNKAQGMVVHPGAGNSGGTLAAALLARAGCLAPAPPPSMLSARPFIVHRLDKDTSGLIIAAWDDEALAFLSAQFKERTVRKTYVAIVRGTPKESSGVISTYIARDTANRKRFTVTADRGKSAVTRYRVVRSFEGYSLLLLSPKTGRTHQLRVHLRHIGCPILGDPIYGTRDSRFPSATLMLHARRLEITLPGHSARSVFSSPLPERFCIMGVGL